MHEVTTRARKMISYTHQWVGETAPTKGKNKGKFPEGEFTIRLRADVNGIVPWITPDQATGRPLSPTAENFDEFLLLVVHPDDLDILADEMQAGHFLDGARFDAAITGWRNSTGETDFLNAAAKLHVLNQRIANIEAVAEKAAEAVEVDDDESGDENTAPLED